MSIRSLLAAPSLALVGMLAIGAPQPATTRPAPILQESERTLTPPAPWDDADPADSLYREARSAMSRNDFARAASMFAEIGRKFPKSTYAADALYYRAYALYRTGGDDNLREAMRALNDQQSRFAKARTSGDARELLVRVRGALAARGDATSAAAVSATASDTTSCTRRGDRDDDDMRAAALNALLQMESETAFPIIKQVLLKRDACSAALRKKAVFLLSQKQTSETESLLIDVSRNDPSHAVRSDAVFWMGQVHTDRAMNALEEIATSSPDMAMRDKALFALTQQNSSRAAAFIRRLAESNDTPSRLRESAIFQLGQNQSRENAEFLRSMFTRLGKSDQNESARKSILFSLSQMRDVGNDKWLVSVAQDASQSMEVRKHALWTAGQAGVSATELIALYDRMTDRAMREQAIWVLSEAHERSAADKLVEIAQKDRDPEMRKKAIFWLGQKNDPRVRQVLLDIINKP